MKVKLFQWHVVNKLLQVYKKFQKSYIIITLTIIIRATCGLVTKPMHLIIAVYGFIIFKISILNQVIICKQKATILIARKYYFYQIYLRKVRI